MAAGRSAAKAGIAAVRPIINVRHSKYLFRTALSFMKFPKINRGINDFKQTLKS